MRKSLSKLLVIGGIAGAVTLASLPNAFGSAATITNVVITQASNTLTVVTFNNANGPGSNWVYLGSVDGLQNTTNWGMAYNQGSIAASASGTVTINGLQYGQNYYLGIASYDITGTTNDWYPLTSGGTSTSFTLGFFQPSSGPVPVSQWPSATSVTNQNSMGQLVNTGSLVIFAAGSLSTGNIALTNAISALSIQATQISNLNAVVSQIATNLLKFPQH